MMEASCSNCVHFKDSTCSLGVTLEEGAKLCDRYSITDSFKEQLVSAFLKEKPIEVKVPIAARVRRAQDEGRPVKGFRSRKQRNG